MAWPRKINCIFELVFLIVILYLLVFFCSLSFFLSALVSPFSPILSSLPHIFLSSDHKISHFFEVLQAGFQDGSKTNLINEFLPGIKINSLSLFTELLLLCAKYSAKPSTYSYTFYLLCTIDLQDKHELVFPSEKTKVLKS